MSSLTTTAKELSDSESLTASCQTPQSLAISEHSLVKGTPQAIRAWLMSSQEVSPVSHSVTRANSLEQMIPATCGPQLLNAYASFDPAMHSWKMYQGWLLQDTLAPLWETWPKAGLIAGGEFFPQPNWERRISAIGSGLLPAPTKSDGGGGPGRGRNKMGGDNLRTAAKMFPTPTTRDWKSGKGAQKRDGHAQPLTDVIGGQLNPTWAEWLLGWPIGWTDLKPLGMDKYQQWLRQHGIY